MCFFFFQKQKIFPTVDEGLNFSALIFCANAYLITISRIQIWSVRHNNLSVIFGREPQMVIDTGSRSNSPILLPLLFLFYQFCGTHRCTRAENRSMWGWADTCGKWNPVASSPSCSWRKRCCWSVRGGTGECVLRWSQFVMHSFGLNHFDQKGDL